MENSQESGSLILEDFYPHFSFSMSSLQDSQSQVGNEELAPLHRKSSQSSKRRREHSGKMWLCVLVKRTQFWSLNEIF